METTIGIVLYLVKGLRMILWSLVKEFMLGKGTHGGCIGTLGQLFSHSCWCVFFFFWILWWFPFLIPWFSIIVWLLENQGWQRYTWWIVLFIWFLLIINVLEIKMLYFIIWDKSFCHFWFIHPVSNIFEPFEWSYSLFHPMLKTAQSIVKVSLASQ